MNGTSITGVLEEAIQVFKERGQQYGSPKDNHASLAKLWGGYLGIEITTQDVVILMMLLKINRLKFSPDHRDSLVDICGYAKVYEVCK